MDPTFSQALDYGSKATVLTILLVLIWGLMTRRWYPAWYVDEQKEKIKRLEEANDKAHEFLFRIVEPIVPPIKKP